MTHTTKVIHVGRYCEYAEMFLCTSNCKSKLVLLHIYGYSDIFSPMPPPHAPHALWLEFKGLTDC